MGYSLWLAARVLLYASSHRQDNSYHSLCYISDGELAGTRINSGSLRWPKVLTTALHLANYAVLNQKSTYLEQNYCTPPKCGDWSEYSDKWRIFLQRCMKGSNMYDQFGHDKSQFHPSCTAHRRTANLGLAYRQQEAEWKEKYVYSYHISKKKTWNRIQNVQLISKSRIHYYKVCEKFIRTN